MDKKFIQNIQGKDFIKFEGLLNEFHQGGGKEIYTKIISHKPFIMQATVKGVKGTYQGVGDADDNNVNRLIANHKIRMAETRAIARALRWYNNIGMCSADEMGGSNTNSVKKPVSSDKLTLLRNTIKTYLKKDNISEDEVIKAISDKAGMTIKSVKELTNEKAKDIINSW